MSALAKIHVAKKQLGLDDDTYRAVLARVTGKDSAKGMSGAEHAAVLEEFDRLGFKTTSKAGRGVAKKALGGPYAKKSQALWIALWNLGAVEDRRDAALLAFVRRQTGIERTEWVLDAEHGKAIVEALKDWCAREGVYWQVGKYTPDHARRHGYQIAAAQWAKLAGAPRIGEAFWGAVGAELGRAVTADQLPTDAEWIRVMNAFGRRIRAGRR